MSRPDQHDEFFNNAPVTAIDAAGTQTSLVAVGDGDPLILLHGAIESGKTIWGLAIPLLAQQFAVVAPDLPGIGRSAPVDHLDVNTFNAWLRAVLDTTGVARPVLVVHSLVGGLALRLAAKDPGLFSRVVVCANSSIGRYKTPNRLKYLAIRFTIRPTEHNAERFDRFLIHDLEAVRRRNPAWYAKFDEFTRERATVRHVKKAMGQLLRASKRVPDGDLAQIRTPVALIWGRHDRAVPLRVAESASQRYGWPLTVIEGVGHAPQVEAPEHFAEAVTAAARR